MGADPPRVVLDAGAAMRTLSSGAMNPRFDDSLDMLGEWAFWLAAYAVFAVAVAVVAFAWAHDRARARWIGAPLRRLRVGGAYRGTSFVAESRSDVPLVVRAGALGCFVFASLFVPMLPAAISAFRFDGIGLALVSGTGLAFAIGCCGWQLLNGRESAPELVRATAIGTLFHNVGLLAIAVTHFVYVETSWAGPVHECSAAIVAMAFLFSASSIPCALLMLAAGPALRPMTTSDAPSALADLVAEGQG